MSLAWCSWRRVTAFAGKAGPGQLAIAVMLTVGSSLNGDERVGLNRPATRP